MVILRQYAFGGLCKDLALQLGVEAWSALRIGGSVVLLEK
jgi:hypothetical protein